MQLLFEAAIMLAATVFLFHWLATANQESFLQTICEEIPGEFYRNTVANRRSYCFNGKFQDRQILLRYSYSAFRWNPRAGSTELEVQVPVVQKFWLRLVPKAGPQEANDNVSIDETLEDQSFAAHSNQQQAATHFLSDPYIRQQFALLGLIRRLEIYRGSLNVRYVNAPVLMDRETFHTALKSMMQIVFFYEMQPAFKITAISASELCPYCRGRLNERIEPVFECKQCHTRLHESCWKENRHCTTWGCNSTLAV
jgi:hypothetical protein